MRLLLEVGGADPEEILQLELAKVATIKIDIFQTFSAQYLEVQQVRSIQHDIQTWYNELSAPLRLQKLLGPTQDLPSPAVYYLHLFYLSATTLLYRRTILHLLENSDSKDTQILKFDARAITIGKEGALCATQIVRILYLLKSAGPLVQKCWLCLYAALP